MLKSALQKYLQAILGSGAVSEIALYKPFAQYILGELLGYPDNCLAINERDNQNTPDIKLYPWPRKRQFEGEVWAVAEGKLDDREVRDPERRAAIWQDQLNRYIRPETFRTILFAPRTICVCTSTGKIEIEVRLGEDKLDFALRGGKWQDAPLNRCAIKTTAGFD